MFSSKRYVAFIIYMIILKGTTQIIFIIFAFAAADSCGSSFAFGLQKHIIASIKLGRVKPDLLYTLRTLPVARMATLLANHDAFAGARLFNQFKGDEKSYGVAAATLLTLPGTPFIYYGEEIGLSAAEPVAQDDQAIRGPMSWSVEAQAGFSRSDKLFRPLVANWKTHNVEAERRDPASLLNHYRQLIALRKSEPALSIGSFTPLSEKDAPILAFLREHEEAKLLVLINYAYRNATLTLPAELQSEQWKAVHSQNGLWPSAPKAADKAALKAVPSTVFTPAGSQIQMAPQQILILKAAGGLFLVRPRPKLGQARDSPPEHLLTTDSYARPIRSPKSKARKDATATR